MEKRDADTTQRRRAWSTDVLTACETSASPIGSLYDFMLISLYTRRLQLAQEASTVPAWAV